MARIPCRVTPDKRIEVDGYVSCPDLNVRGPVVFVIDTGSPVTSLGQKDAEGMGMDVSRLMNARIQFAGIGGFSVSYEIPNVDIIVLSGGEHAICRLETVYLHRKTTKKRKKTKGSMVYEHEAVAAAPSILGYDALSKMRLKLEVQFAEDKAVLVQ